MTADPARQTETGTHTSETERRAWAVPAFTRLRAGLAETGPNAGYDGVEGTS